MSDSDFGGSDDLTKKRRSKKSRQEGEKPKKQKRSRTFDGDSFGKNKQEKRKQISENEFEDGEEREHKNKDRMYRKTFSETSGEKSRDRKRKVSPSEGEIEHEKGSSRHNVNESKPRESNREKVSKNRVDDAKKRRKDTIEGKYNSDFKYEEIRNKKGRSRSEDQNGDLKKKKTYSKYEENEEQRHNKTGSRFEKSRDFEDNKSRGNKLETIDESDYNERKRNRNDGDGEDKHNSNYEKPQRYWSNSRPLRENCDSYWNKYNDRFKESTENMEVGPRYYSTSEKPQRDHRDKEGEKDLRKDTVDGDNNDKTKDVESGEKADEKNTAPKRTKAIDILTSRTGGAYIPPAKLKMMQESITDKGSAAYQRLAWEALKKSIQGHVNKVNVSNIISVLKAVQKENIVRGRGLLCRALIQAQAASPTFTNVYAALVAVLNAKFPKIGELLLKRLVVQFRRGFKRNDKTICITAATFIAHLVNQEVAHEILALEILTLLIETPTDDSVEVAIAFLKECGMKLTEVASKGVLGIFDMLRNILHEGKLEKRVQYMIEVMFQIRKEDFKAHPALIDDLDLLDQEDRITHLISLEENHDPEDILNVFKFDPDYEDNEAKYKARTQESDEEGSDGESSGSADSEDESEEEEGEEQEKQGVIVDKTETNLVALRKTIYLTIQSSLDFEECAHKLLKMELKPGQEIEMAHMFLDCCAEQRTYEKFFGLLSQRFCQINRSYIGPFEETFRDSYATIHRMSNDKLRNIAKLFAHLLYTDAISWDVLATIRLNEDDTTSSSRIFIKILFQELSEYMGLAKLNQRVKDPALQSALEGLFPRDNPKHTRFAINFFTSIGLGGITDELREHLKSMPKPTIAVPQLVGELSSSSDSSSSDSSSDSSDSSSDSSTSSDSSSSHSSRKKKKKETMRKKKNDSTSRKVDKTNTSNKKTSSVPKQKRNR